ncbi:MAG: hypothetical protein IKS37_07045 [Solobacterium sp.]|nr:hypothetical protein [Solobacterium sp.]
MQRTNKERRVAKDAFRRMNKAEKIDYIFTYYKLPIFTVCVVLALFLQAGIHALTKKDPILYNAYANVSFGDTLREELTDGYLAYSGKNPNKFEITEYPDLYLSEDASGENHQYAYASRIKVLGSISAKRMDIVFMNKEAYDLMSESGLLADLKSIQEIDASLYKRLELYLTDNTVILEDNSVEFDLGEASVYSAVTEEQTNAVNVTSLPLIHRAQTDGDVYAAIIANSPRITEALSYLDYLLSAD